MREKTVLNLTFPRFDTRVEIKRYVQRIEKTMHFYLV